MSKGWLLVALMLLCSVCNAQEKSLVQKGNKLYEQRSFRKLQLHTSRPYQTNPTYTPGTFNLGNALIQQKKYDAARKVMAVAAKNSKASGEQSGANYNIGNTYMAESKWQDAVDAYKQALRRNPYDGDAKYNLSYALSKLKQQQGGGGKDKDKKDDKNKKDDKKDQDKKKDDQKDKDKQDQQDKNQDQKDKEDKDQQHPQPQESKLTEKQAENLLNALQQDERKLQDKAQKAKGMPVKLEKDW